MSSVICVQCDRVIPICGLCTKFERRCLYEKPTRTPLTRRYLNDVEQELARTKEQLRQALPSASEERPQQLGNDESNQAEGRQATQAGHEAHANASPRHAECTSSSGEISSLPRSGTEMNALEVTGYVSDRSSGAILPAAPLEQTHSPASVLQATGGIPPPNNQLPLETQNDRSTRKEPEDHRSAERVSQRENALSFPMEMQSPSIGDNFEWDERSGRSDMTKFVDGMASLSNHSNEGYLGRHRHTFSKYKRNQLKMGLRRCIWGCPTACR